MENSDGLRVSAGLKFTLDILSKQPQYCSHIWNFFRTFFQTLIFTTIKETAICPSHNETRGSFATISDGKCGLIDLLAFYLMRRLEHVDRQKWVGYCFFCCYLQSLLNSLVTESGCSDNDGAGKLFWGLKKL